MAILDVSKDLSYLFSQQVAATPSAVAAEDGTTTWTYSELDRAVSGLTDRLRRKNGVGRDVQVGVLMGHSVAYVVACLAALRAGGAFLVLEVAYPPALLAEVIADGRPAVVVTSAEYAGKLGPEVERVVLAEDKAELLAAADRVEPLSDALLDPLPEPTDLERLAFVSYSSGTTGRPKGIANPHSAPVRSYDLRFGISNLGLGDRVACNVFFVWEMLRPLLRGATTVAVPDRISYDPVGLVEFLAANRITETLMTPTLLATVLGRFAGSGSGSLAVRLQHLHTLWLNGEVVTVDLAKRAMAALPHTRLLNCYSASETHEIACCDLAEAVAALPADATVCPAGRPLDPDHTYVLDDNGQRVGPGVSGELYVGGGLLARGYLNRPETTAEVFVPDRFIHRDGDKKEARMYRTGDRACLLPSGDLEISGRVGGMIKLRGYTVQPASVESAIVKRLAVRSCVVLAHGDGLDRQLVAYVVHDDGAAATTARPALAIDAHGHSPAARRLLLTHLAHYMIPTLWVQLDTLPTHEVSGKVDIKGLPPPRAIPSPPETPPPERSERPERSGRAPASAIVAATRTATPSAIASHWAACLSIDPAAAAAAAAAPDEYDFFDIGGHSLALADLSSRLSAAYGITVPLASLVNTPTLRGHLQAVNDALGDARRGGGIRPSAAAEREALLALMKKDATFGPEKAHGLVSQTSDNNNERDPATPLSQAKNILLTGATGFLGAFLLRELLDKTDATILCLVRPADVEDNGNSMPRLRRHLLELGLWSDSMADRIELVLGDLARPRLGLASSEEFAALAARVQAIFHAGATVNLVYPYEALRAANVEGTREILRLAMLGNDGSNGGDGIRVHYISTNGVLPPAAAAWPESAVLPAERAVDELESGYDKTKWVAESLVREAATARHLLSVAPRIYRLGTLGGHSGSGTANPRDVVTALLVESLRIGKAPEIAGWRIEMTPVDFAAAAIVALAGEGEEEEDKEKKKGDRDGEEKTVFHIGDPQALPAEAVFQYFAELGYPTKPVAWEDWKAAWAANRSSSTSSSSSRHEPSPADILFSGMPSLAFLETVTMLDDNTVTRPHLKSLGLHRPELDLAVLATYARHFYARGWLAKAPRRTVTAIVQDKSKKEKARPLAGRVAIVVGASSGIGAAVATALARDGADVAVAARRSDALKDLQTRLEADYGVRVLSQATDVVDAVQVQLLMRNVTEQLGGIDILVICAGVMYYTLMANAQTDEWERTVDVNCKGLLHCLAATVPGMLARGRGGHVVAISSDAGRKVFPGLGVYSGSKFFVEAVLQSLRLETVGTGLRVTSVQPGNTATDLLGISTDQEALAKYGTPSGAQVLSPNDVAEAVAYAVRQAPHVAVNEVLIEPRDEPI